MRVRHLSETGSKLVQTGGVVFSVAGKAVQVAIILPAGTPREAVSVSGRMCSEITGVALASSDYGARTRSRINSIDTVVGIAGRRTTARN
jgi:hypothetical protein